MFRIVTFLSPPFVVKKPSNPVNCEINFIVCIKAVVIWFIKFLTGGNVRSGRDTDIENMSNGCWCWVISSRGTDWERRGLFVLAVQSVDLKSIGIIHKTDRSQLALIISGELEWCQAGFLCCSTTKIITDATRPHSEHSGWRACSWCTKTDICPF